MVKPLITYFVDLVVIYPMIFRCLSCLNECTLPFSFPDFYAPCFMLTLLASLV